MAGNDLNHSPVANDGTGSLDLQRNSKVHNTLSAAQYIISHNRTVAGILNFANRIKDLANRVKDHATWVIKNIKRRIARNPHKTAALIVAVVVAVCPSALIVPVLAALGFTSLGPALGSLAAAFQSAFGATAGFGFLQSAAMGGVAAHILPVVVGMAAVALAIFLIIHIMREDDEEEANSCNETASSDEN